MIELLDISVSKTFGKDKRKLGRGTSRAQASLKRHKRRLDQKISFTDIKPIDSGRFGNYVWMKNLFNEGFDFRKLVGFEK